MSELQPDPLEQALRAKLHLPDTDEQDAPDSTGQSTIPLNDADALTAVLNAKLGINTTTSNAN